MTQRQRDIEDSLSLAIAERIQEELLMTGCLPNDCPIVVVNLTVAIGIGDDGIKLINEAEK